MSTDPRDLIVEAEAHLSLLRHRYLRPETPGDLIREVDQVIGELRSAADAVDPLRAFLTNPDDERVERLSELWYHTTSEGHADVRAVLADLADGFGVTR